MSSPCPQACHQKVWISCAEGPPDAVFGADKEGNAIFCCTFLPFAGACCVQGKLFGINGLTGLSRPSPQACHQKMWISPRQARQPGRGAGCLFFASLRGEQGNTFGIKALAGLPSASPQACSQKMWISRHVGGISRPRRGVVTPLPRVCTTRKREKKSLMNQGLAWLVKALSTSLPPESVDKGLPAAGPGGAGRKLGISVAAVRWTQLLSGAV